MGLAVVFDMYGEKRWLLVTALNTSVQEEQQTRLHKLQGNQPNEYCW